MKRQKRHTCRLQLEVEPRVRKQLEQLSERVRAGSMVEVIRRALVMYQVLLDEAENGVVMIGEKYHAVR